MSKIVDYIKENQVEILSLFNKIQVYQHADVSDSVDLSLALRELETLPEHFFNEIDSIFVGQFDFLRDREMDALYKDGAIYVSNLQDNTEDFISDIIHEVAHSLEETYPHDIYGDGRLETEFLSKRKTMFRILDAHEMQPPDMEDFFVTDYSVHFDNYLYKDVGYERLHNLLSGLFISPYGATSLREYFANAFEEYFTGDPYYVETLSPVANEKILQLQGF